MKRPTAAEFAPFFQSYVDRVPGDELLPQLRLQAEDIAARCADLNPAVGAHCYAPGKWSVNRVLQHIVDGERMFTYRALCIARGEQQALPGFDENAYAANDGSQARTAAAIVTELLAVRVATLALFESFEASCWSLRGIANGNAFTVRALAWITAGHAQHHLVILRERYGVG